MTTLYLANDHSTMLHLWRRRNTRGLRLLRFDAHCDLRGLVFDEERKRAAPRWDPRLLQGSVDGGNFLSHAVLEGRIRSIRWIHGPHGGRERDVGTVALVSDFPQRWLLRFRRAWVPLEFRSQLLTDASLALETGEQLDVDFDYFASRLAPQASIEPAIQGFFQLPWSNRPREIYLARSPAYCHVVPKAMQAFVDRLAERFSADVVELPDPPPAKRPGRLERVGYRVDKMLRSLEVRR